MTVFATRNMGSFVSQLANERTALNRRPPSELGELLQAYEKNSDNYWFTEFSNHLRELDVRTRQSWRKPLLQFILLVRQAKVLSTGSEELEKVLERVWQEHLRHDCEHPLALSNPNTREKLVEACRKLVEKGEEVEGKRLGLQSLSAQVLRGTHTTEEGVIELLGEAYLDIYVWNKMEREYEKFLKKNPSPPPLAVLLSIL